MKAIRSMSRLSMGDRTNLSRLLAQRALRQALRGVQAHRLLRWQFGPSKTDRLIIAPQDLRTGDATRASEIHAGRFAFAGKVVVSDGRPLFEMIPPSDEWAAALLGFGWLRHLRTADSSVMRATARALVEEWISSRRAWSPVAWRPEVLARRIISWLSQAPLVLHDTDERFYRRFLRSLSRQVRFLRRALRDSRDGVPRLQSVIALTYATLCMERQGRHLRRTVHRLVEELDQQVLPDGGHISRNPSALIELLLDLLPLRQAFASRNIPPPAALLNAIDRMMPMLRFFRHGDGDFAHFNGMGPTSADLIATILAYDDARGTPLAHAPHSGYQRLDAAGVTVLMDTGRPPPINVSHEAHAGCLSFELSSRNQLLVVNCGMPAVARENWRELARATAAHSTATFADASSCRFVRRAPFRRLLLGAPIIAGPTDVKVTRDNGEDGQTLRASHDGYLEFGVLHRRMLMLARDGGRLEGEDSFTTPDGDMRPTGKVGAFAVRFHLHPSVNANRLPDDSGIMLMLGNKEAWTFTADGSGVDIEESVYLGGREGPRRTVQLVLRGDARETAGLRWAFTRTASSSGAGARRNRPQIPLP